MALGEFPIEPGFLIIERVNTAYLRPDLERPHVFAGPVLPPLLKTGLVLASSTRRGFLSRQIPGMRK